MVTDDEFAAGIPNDARVAILPYNSNLSAKEILACQRVVARGGKLIVMFSADAQLAALMGFRLGVSMRAPGSDSWNAFRFVAGTLPTAPLLIKQPSLTILPVSPADKNSKVIAWWESASGHLPREPAWVQSDRGFWMSHILLESDVAAKKMLLISLLGACDRDLWQAAAAQSVTQAGRLGKYQTAAQALSAIKTEGVRDMENPVLKALIVRAEQLQRDVNKQYQTGNYEQVLASAHLLNITLTEAFARVQTTKKDEFRGVWNHSGTGFIPGSWDQTCQSLASSGMTAVLPNVQRPWCAHYPSRLIPASDVLARNGDQMADCVKAAKRQGIDTHAWVILWNLEGAPESMIAPYRKAGRLQISANGETIPWLCPSHPANRTFELAAIKELAERYPDLSGIHLDYIRYKTQDYCYCNGCRTRFTQTTGIQINHWPRDVRSGSKQAAYKEWRRDQITRFVAETRQELKRLNPNLKLSASVYPLYPGVRDSIAQDWGEWVRQGLVDFVCPMNYTSDPVKFIDWYRKQAAYPGAKGKVFAGIGVTSLECRLTAVETITQINALRQEGANGFTLFEANPTLKDDILPYLQMGTTAK